MDTIDLSFLFMPEQREITIELIREMITWKPRRNMLSIEWLEPIHPPRNEGEDWSLVLPFCETLKNAFEFMCNITNTIGLRMGKGDPSRCYTYIKEVRDNPECLDKIRQWIATIGEFVAIRDCLAISFALDYDREKGDPERNQTKIGNLRSKAKP